MKNEKKVCIGIFIAFSLLFTSCHSGSITKGGVWIADVRKAIQTETPISIKKMVVYFHNLLHRIFWM